MSHIYCIGETVYDIIFKNECPASGTPGGAMLNTSITLGRIGIPIHFISEVGYDRIGSGILSFLKENGVSTHFIKQEDESKTALALAFLDKDQDATYDFYKSSPEQDFTVSTPEFTANDFFLFGSFFALSSRYIPALKTLILVAQEAGALIFYDPNFREAHLDELENLKPLIIQNIRNANIIRGSDQDFRHIFGLDNPDDVWKAINDPGKVLIYTANKTGVTLITNNIRKDYPVHTITPVSTIGAGDNFNAGILYSMYNNGVTGKEISKLDIQKWNEIVSAGIDFGTRACLTMENYLTKKEVDKLKTR